MESTFLLEHVTPHGFFQLGLGKLKAKALYSIIEFIELTTFIALTIVIIRLWIFNIETLVQPINIEKKKF